MFRSGDWAHYQAVNRKFAAAAVQEVDADDPIILVQDYHFALAPRMIREQLPKATIITFWHIPWPNFERLGICPWSEEILDGLLGSSILGLPHAVPLQQLLRLGGPLPRSPHRPRVRRRRLWRHAHAGPAVSDLDRLAQPLGPGHGVGRELPRARSSRSCTCATTRGSAWASIGWTTPRASRSACWRWNGCSRPTPSIAASSRSSRLRRPAARRSRSTRRSADRVDAIAERVNKRFGDGTLPARSSSGAGITSRRRCSGSSRRRTSATSAACTTA